MISDPDEIGVDGTVWLYPQSKTASTNVHRQLKVKILKDPRAHWPMVVVGWTEEGRDMWELVHRDNIRKRSPGAVTTKEEKTQGDSIGDGRKTKGAARIRVMPGARKYQPTDEQLELF